jgi:hypothetical protein
MTTNLPRSRGAFSCATSGARRNQMSRELFSKRDLSNGFPFPALDMRRWAGCPSVFA